MNDFEELRLNTGVGEEHVNRYRIYFKAKGGSTAQQFAETLRTNFPTYFNPGNVATVRKGKRGVNTLQFTIHLNLNFPPFHDDWVAIEWTSRKTNEQYRAGFAVQTLRRKFDDETDDFIEELAEGSTLPTVFVAPEASAASVYAAGQLARSINKSHFLAGRRSWMFCDAAHDPDLREGPGASPPKKSPSDGQLFFLETAAVEKESAVWFQPLDAIPPLAWLMMGHNLRDTIDLIWSTLISNFVRMYGFQPADAPPDPPRVSQRWQKKGHVYYTTQHWERQSVISLHPFLGS